MSVSLRDAFRRVFKEECFLPNYTALVVMSFCSGLLYFAMRAKNIPYILPSVVLAIAALILSEGYHLKYFKAITSEVQPTMPDWKKFGFYGLTGLKFFAASIILGMVFTSVIMILITILLVFGLFLKSAMSAMFLAFAVIVGIGEMLICLCMPAFVYVFTDMDESVTSFLFLNKVFKNFSCSYFVALFLIAVLSSLNAILAVLTTINIKYVLLYIIPLMITPFLRLVSDNIMAQAYIANKNGQKDSAGKMIIYMFLAVAVIAGLFFFVYVAETAKY